MQISKKRELSRQSELKEYCGNGCCCQNLKFSLGQSLRQECWGPWREAGDAGMKCPGGNSKSCACVRACVCARVRMCWGKGIVTVGDKGLSAAREPMRGRITSGMTEQEVKGADSPRREMASKSAGMANPSKGDEK